MSRIFFSLIFSTLSDSLIRLSRLLVLLRLSSLPSEDRSSLLRLLRSWYSLEATLSLGDYGDELSTSFSTLSALSLEGILVGQLASSRVRSVV